MGTADTAERTLRRLIAAKPGERLPGERDLVDRLRLSRPQLRRLLGALAHQGLVVRRHGSGTYAAGAAAGRALATVTLLLDEGFRLGQDPWCATVLEHLSSAAEAAGARLGLARSDGATRPSALGDGVIVLGAGCHRALARWRAEDPPAVGLFADATPSARVSIVGLDEESAGEAAARALLGGRRRELLFLGRRDLPGVRRRLAGVEGAAAAAGATVTVRDCGLNHAAGRAIAADVAVDGLAGIIAANDWLAVGLRAGLAARGGAAAKLPLVAFDGLAIAADPALAIASLQPPYAAIAADCVAELARLATAPGRVLGYACAWRA